MKHINDFRVLLIGLSGKIPDDIGSLLVDSGRSLTHLDSLAALATGAHIVEGLNVVVAPARDLVPLDRHADLRRGYGRSRFIALVDPGDVPMAVEAMKAGAVDALEWPSRERALPEMVQAVGADLARDSESGRGPSPLDRLSARERSVLYLLVEGRSNKLIGQELGISERTVEVHRANIMRKLHVSSFAALIKLALAAGTP